MARTLAAEEVTTFYKDGYVIVKNFPDRGEIDELYQTTIIDQVIRENAGASRRSEFLNKKKGPALQQTAWDQKQA